VSVIKEALVNALARRGFEPAQRQDLDPEFRALYERCKDYTLTSVERMYAMYSSTKHVVEREIPGDIVECGVFAGGSMMLAAHTLLELGDDSRTIWLYDTFTGMAEPTAQDGPEAHAEWKRAQRGDMNMWCYASLEDVRRNMAATGYPESRIRYVQGMVEETIPDTAPERIALLRLDTDWYESTYHELVHLYPRLSSGGALILDDYGYWKGMREAVDRYFEQQGERPLLTRVDYFGRVGVKA
jgi:O-methyltransferase